MNSIAETRKWEEADVPDQSGRVAIVTGANTGLGYRHRRGAGRRAARTSCSPCATSRRATPPLSRDHRAPARGADVTLQALDLSSLDSVRAAADALRSAYPRIDLLINNAGVMY